VIPASVVAWILLVLVALVAPGAMACADGEPSDVGLHGAKSRPDERGDGARQLCSSIADLALRSRLPCLISS
jgi:hypothetical protein